MNKLQAVYIFLLIFCCLSISVAQDSDELPLLTDRVSDLTQTLSAYQSNQINDQLILFEQQTNITMAILIIKTTGTEPIEDYAIRLAENWKIGNADKDNGLILLIAKEDREVRIEVGYGLEEIFTDATTHRIIADAIAPKLTQNNYLGGVMAGITALESTVSSKKGEGFINDEPPDPVSEDSYRLFLMIILGVAIGIFIFKKIVAKNR